MSQSLQCRIDAALRVFVRGFSYTRSLTHPYEWARVDGLWVMRDAPRRRKSDRDRAEEWVGCDVPPQVFDRVVRANARGRFGLCVVVARDQDDAPMRAAFKSLGYHLRATEPLMVQVSTRIPRLSCPLSIKRVTTLAEADALARAAGRRQVLSEHLSAGDASPLWQYVATTDDGAIVAWGRSIAVDNASWVSNIFTTPKFRRRGIARALLARLLRDDRARGLRRSVLLSSHTGALLYEAVGFERIAKAYLYTPRRSL
jgi:GNAT superfamily N-acetyltransferase